MTHLEKLDFVLKIISEKKDFTYSQEIFRLNQDKFQGGELGIIVNKLVLDDLVEKRIDYAPTNNKIKPDDANMITK